MKKQKNNNMSSDDDSIFSIFINAFVRDPSGLDLIVRAYAMLGDEKASFLIAAGTVVLLFIISWIFLGGEDTITLLFLGFPLYLIIFGLVYGVRELFRQKK